MPTRAAAAAAAAANTRTTRSSKVPTQLKDKENGPPSSTTKPKEKLAPRKTSRIVKAKKVEEMFCSCRGIDDGTPMVQCGTCDEWSALIRPLSLTPSFIHPSNGTDIPCSSRYHFRCIQLSEDDASEISESLYSLCFNPPLTNSNIF
jgi:hypothetical protein